MGRYIFIRDSQVEFVEAENVPSGIVEGFKKNNITHFLKSGDKYFGYSNTADHFDRNFEIFDLDSPYHTVAFLRICEDEQEILVWKEYANKYGLEKFLIDLATNKYHCWIAFLAGDRNAYDSYRKEGFVPVASIFLEEAREYQEGVLNGTIDFREKINLVKRDKLSAYGIKDDEVLKKFIAYADAHYPGKA